MMGDRTMKSMADEEANEATKAKVVQKQHRHPTSTHVSHVGTQKSFNCKQIACYHM